MEIIWLLLCRIRNSKFQVPSWYYSEACLLRPPLDKTSSLLRSLNPVWKVTNSLKRPPPCWGHFSCPTGCCNTVEPLYNRHHWQMKIWQVALTQGFCGNAWKCKVIGHYRQGGHPTGVQGFTAHKFRCIPFRIVHKITVHEHLIREGMALALAQYIHYVLE